MSLVILAYMFPEFTNQEQSFVWTVDTSGMIESPMYYMAVADLHGRSPSKDIFLSLLTSS